MSDEVVKKNDPGQDEPEEEEEEPEIEDPVDALRDACNAQAGISKAKSALEECATRVSSKNETTENCHEEMIDYIHALDKCVSKDLFTKLK